MSQGSTVKSQQFVSELTQFYRNKGQVGLTPQHLVARLNGQPVNLWELYTVVLEMGGSFKVNQYSRWDEVYSKLFQSPPAGANVSVALRQIYQRLLMPYEKVNFSNFTSDVLDDDDDDDHRRTMSNRETANSFVLHSSFSLPHGHHHSQYHHQLLLQQQQLNGGPNSFVNPLNKLYCALLSGLPNEMDFGLRIATMLAGSREVEWISDYKFIEVLLDCCTTYACTCNEQQQPEGICEVYDNQRIVASTTAAGSSSANSVAVDGDQPTQQTSNGDSSSSLSSSPSCPVSTFCKQNLVMLPKRCVCLANFWSIMCKDSSVIDIVFAQDVSRQSSSSVSSNDPLDPLQQHSKDVTYKKVKRIAELIRTLSFVLEQQIPSEDKALCAPVSLLKFLVLLLSSQDSLFNTIGLDIISNVVSHLISISENEEYMNLQQFVYRQCVSLILDSKDVHSLNRALEVITKIMTTGLDDVTTYVIRLLDDELYGRLIELLTCQHDVSLVISTLEFCLALSDQYPKLLLRENKLLIKILLNLLNCEASQHFTPLALSKVKVCDAKHLSLQQQLQHQSTGAVTAATTISINPQSPLRVVTGQHQSSQVPANLDNESFALHWLKCTFDVVNGTTSKPQPHKIADIYAEYVKHCCRNGRRNVISVKPFASYIKKAFTSSNIIGDTLVEGLSQKTVAVMATTSSLTVKTQQPGQLASPILKAHLSAPTRGPLSPTGNSTTTPSTTPAAATTTTAATTNTSTLIKSLLATKLRNNASAASSTATTPSIVSATPLSVATATAALKAGAVNSTTSTPTPIVKKEITITAVTTAANFTTKANNMPNAVFSVAGDKPAVPAATNQMIVVKSDQSHQPVNIISNNGEATNKGGLLVNASTAPMTVVTSSAVTSMPMMTAASLSTGQPQQQQIIFGNAQLGQAPQQFLLVRTIVGGQQQVGQLVGVPTGNGQFRLVLPTGMTYQRPMTVNTASINVNGVASNAQQNQQQQPQSNSLSTAVVSNSTPAANATSSSANDILLKAVLGSGIDTDMPASPPNSGRGGVANAAVKSSPLLNVLLDKGKLPEYSATTAAGQQQVNVMTTTTAVTNTGITVNCVPQQKMYILTTKSGVPLKSMGIQQQIQGNTVQIIQSQSALQQQQQANALQAHISQSQTVQNAAASTSMKPVVVNAEVQKQQHVVVNHIVSSPMQNSTGSGVPIQMAVKPVASITSAVAPPLTNGEVQGASVLAAVQADETNAKKPSNSNDLSPIKDIQKAMDDATKLISYSKRPSDQNANDPSSQATAAKKPKTNSISSPVGATIVQAVTTKMIISNGETSTLPNNKNGVVDGVLPATSVATLTTVSKPVIANSVAVTPDTQMTLALSSAVTNAVQPPKPLEYNCEWHLCKRSFQRPTQVYKHVYDDHVIVDKTKSLTTVMSCEWGGPEGLGPGCQSKRPKLSLLAHIQDFHCNPHLLHQIAVRNQQLGKSGATNFGLPQPPPAHPGYAHNAAMLAIKRHAVNYVEPLSLPPITPTTPITVSIRLTAALVLRNLAEHSTFIQRSLQCYESYISELCVNEGRDESRTLAQCLAVIFDKNRQGRKS